MSEDSLHRLREVMDRLRSPGGCPWDREQDHRSLTRYLLEESYEFIDAIERGDRDEIIEELGDLLLQVFFHARIGEERSDDPFDIDVVAEAVARKLVSRHPHVFTDDPDAAVDSADQVLRNWERIKNVEKSRDDIFDGVPTGQPSLSLATKYVQRALKNEKPLPSRDLPRGDEVDPTTIGLALLALIRVAVENGIDPESELRKATFDYAESIDRSVDHGG
ncbi:MAG: MazG family protein [Candidatus Nanopelagicaceae bacterium]